MLVFHQSKSTSAIKRILSTTATYISSYFFHVIMFSLSLRCILARLRVEVKTKSNTILQLNTKGLTANRISAVEQLVDKNKALVTINQNHCIKADNQQSSVAARPKGGCFFSHPWNVGTNPDLGFASVGQDNQLPDRRVPGKFPRSQHRLFLITLRKLKVPAYSDPLKRWNFRKAAWKSFCLLLGESVSIADCPLRTQRKATMMHKSSK